MATCWTQQALIEAPVEEVWELLGDPSRFPEWNGDTIEVTGLPTHIEKGSTFEHTGRTPLGTKATTTYSVDEFDDLKEIKLRCTTSGFYSHWVLTEARGNTFAEVELGVEPHSLTARAFAVTVTKGFLRRNANRTLDGMRRLLGRGRTEGADSDASASAENVEIAMGMYAAFNRGDREAAFAYLSPAIEWETDPRHPKAGVYRGREAFQRFLEDLEDPFEQTITEPEEFFAKGDQIVAFIKIRRRPRGSTSEVEIQIGELWTVRDGKLVRGQGFGEREKALEAAGMTKDDAVSP